MNKKQTEVIISLKNLEYNAKSICEKFKDYKYRIGVLKSNAYGHGYKVVNSFIKGGINYIAVSYISEALEIRKYSKDIPVLCMQPILIDDIDLAIKNNITITIHSLSYLKELISVLNNKIKVHIKIDSGMNRLGFKNKDEVSECYKLINENKFIELEGIYTHLATTGIFDKNWDNQISNFKKITKDIDLNSIKIVHLYNSNSLLNHDKLDFANGFRIGIALYGYNVNAHYSNIGAKNKLRNMRNTYYRKKYNISDINYDIDIDLKRAMFMKTYILDIKKINKGESIGYGASKVEKDMLVAILPIGYANGIGHSNNRFVLINDKKYHMIGQMSMNMMMIEVDDNVNMNDEVIILGKSITIGQLSRFNNKEVPEMLLEVGNNNNKVYLEDDSKWV